MNSQSQKYRDKCKKLLVCMPKYVKYYYISKTINSYSQISLNNYLIEFRLLFRWLIMSGRVKQKIYPMFH